MCTVRLLDEKRILTLKKKWCRRLGKRSRLTSISANGQYQYLCILSPEVVFQARILATSNSTTCACQTRFTFHVKYQNNRMALISEKVIKSILEASSGAIRDPTFWKVFSFYQSLSFSIKVTFLCRSLSCTSSTRRCLTIHGVYSSFSRLFLHLGLFLTQFLSILFSGSKRMKTAK